MTAEQIRTVVESLFEVNIGHPTRQRHIVEARQMYFYFALNYGDKLMYIDGKKVVNKYSLSEIGKTLGFDHSTVIYACKKVEDLIDVDVQYRKKFYHILESIKRSKGEEIPLDPVLVTLKKDLEIDVIKKRYDAKITNIKKRFNNDWVKLMCKIPVEYRTEFIKTRFEPYLKMKNVL